MTTIFSKIIAGEIPSYKLYEDEFTFAFLDIFPQVPGHTIIVPKIEVPHFSDIRYHIVTTNYYRRPLKQILYGVRCPRRNQKTYNCYKRISSLSSTHNR